MPRGNTVISFFAGEPGDVKDHNFLATRVANRNIKYIFGMNPDVKSYQLVYK